VTDEGSTEPTDRHLLQQRETSSSSPGMLNPNSFLVSFFGGMGREDFLRREEEVRNSPRHWWGVESLQEMEEARGTEEFSLAETDFNLIFIVVLRF